MGELSDALMKSSIAHMTVKFRQKFDDFIFEMIPEIASDEELRESVASRHNPKIIAETMINLLTRQLGWFLAVSRAEGREISFTWLNNQLFDAMARYIEDREESKRDDDDEEDDEEDAEEDDDDDEGDEGARCDLLKAQRDFWFKSFFALEDRLIAVQKKDDTDDIKDECIMRLKAERDHWCSQFLEMQEKFYEEEDDD